LEDIRKGRVISSEATNATALQKERKKELEGMHIVGYAYITVCHMILLFLLSVI
jgi:hypothetical protein